METLQVVETPPRTPLRELTALRRPLVGGGGVHCSSPRTTPLLSASDLDFRPFGLQAIGS